MLASPIAMAAAMKLPDKVAFTAFGFEIYWYGVLLAVGVILAILLAHLECKRRALSPDTAVDLCLITLPCGVIGARIVYVLLNLSMFKGRAVQMLYLWDGGLSAIGAVLFALVGVAIYAAKKKIRYLKLLDVLAPAVTAALAISAWGHFFNQDFFGAAVTRGALKWFPLCVRLDDGSIHLALFLYLFVWLVLIFAYLWFALRKSAKHDGDLAFAFVLLYSLATAVLSALRKDGTGNYLTQQIVSAVIFVAVLLFLLIRALREKRLGKRIWPAPEEGAEQADEPAGEEPADDSEPDAAEDTDESESESAEDTAASESDAAENADEGEKAEEESADTRKEE